MSREPEIERRAYALFCQLLPLDDTTRARTLDREVASEPALRSAVEALLAADAETTGPLDAVTDPWALDGEAPSQSVTFRDNPTDLEPGMVVADRARFMPAGSVPLGGGGTAG